MKSNSKILMTLSFLWSGVLFLLAGWWLYLMINFDSILTHIDKLKFTKMILWEGSSFVVLLILLSSSLLFFYLMDQKKSKAMQDFFASLTHELKTPLASIKLQGEVIGELISERNEPQLKNLLKRLTDDTIKLETQMDKILQLSRIERGGELNLTNIKLLPLLKSISNDWIDQNDIKIECNNSNVTIIADEFALVLILKNLFENTKTHSKSNLINISIIEENNLVTLSYNDHGEFTGDPNRLATLFYKHNSSKGSGIGLYLIKKLSEKMNTKFDIKFYPNITFELCFNSSEDIHA